MPLRRDATCPLCGARLSPTEVLAACEAVADATLGVLACTCPACQGHFEVLPAPGRVDIGYATRGLFEVAVSLPCGDLRAQRTGDGGLEVVVGERVFEFRE